MTVGIKCLIFCPVHFKSLKGLQCVSNRLVGSGHPGSPTPMVESQWVFLFSFRVFGVTRGETRSRKQSGVGTTHTHYTGHTRYSEESRSQ